MQSWKQMRTITMLFFTKYLAVKKSLYFLLVLVSLCSILFVMDLKGMMNNRYGTFNYIGQSMELNSPTQALFSTNTRNSTGDVGETFVAGQPETLIPAFSLGSGQPNWLFRTLLNGLQKIVPGKSNSGVERFKVRVSEHELHQFKEILILFDKLMTESGVLYFLYGGTLIGSYRHHDIIPWDDDVDVIMPLAQQRTLKLQMHKLKPNYALYAGLVHFWKLFPANGQGFPKYDWKWPFLDIFFYDENETHIWDAHPTYTKAFCYPKTDVFPLRRRPFFGLSMPTPHNTRAVLERTYNTSECHSGGWVHRWERYSSFVTIPCSLLHSTFPFVRRQNMNNGCNETLMYKERGVHHFFDWGFKC